MTQIGKKDHIILHLKEEDKGKLPPTALASHEKVKS